MAEGDTGLNIMVEYGGIPHDAPEGNGLRRVRLDNDGDDGDSVFWRWGLYSVNVVGVNVKVKYEELYGAGWVA